MSKHKKKKSNANYQDKVARAQHKNEYLRKIRKVLDAIGCSHVWALMPADELDDIYLNRCQAVNVTIAEGDVMPPGKLKWIKQLLSAMLKRSEVKVLEDSGTIDLDTFFTAGITLTIYTTRILEEDRFPKAAEVKEALILFAMDMNYKNKAFIHLRQILVNMSVMMSDMTRRMFWATVDLKMAESGYNNAIHVVWHSVEAKKRNVKINGELHLAYRVGLPQYRTGPHWITYPPGDYDFPGAQTSKAIDVYIQAHALKRLTERNDCVTRESILLELMKSLTAPKYKVDPQTGKILIDFNLYNVKTGYLLASMDGNKLVIRTFLFITLTGSPEGNRLLRNAHLKKHEIEFLELDRLSTFMTSEIQENKRIKQYFVDAGLKSLFDLYKILKEKNIAITKHPNTTLIEDYLGIDLTKEFREDEMEEDEETDDENLSDFSNGDIPVETSEAGVETKEETTTSNPENTRKRISLAKRIYLTCAVFVLRAFALLIPRSIKEAEDGEATNGQNDTVGDEPAEKDKKPSLKLSLPGKILGWIFLITLGIPGFIMYALISVIFIPKSKRRKKKIPIIDYKQFQHGRKRKKKKK